MNTLRDLVKKLLKYDETTVIDLLDIRTEDLLNRFEDKIEERFEEIEAFLDDEGYELNFDDDEQEDY
jgi:hypothetical protein